MFVMFFIDIILLFILPTTSIIIWNFIFKQYNICFLASIYVLHYMRIL